ncbi:MAG TPA: hypothetical protein VMZ71_02030 [Gemmataceae bacterium]|nr:hypothetical protein [Gemmataceae bacterium]
MLRGTARTVLTGLESFGQEITGVAGDLAASGPAGGAVGGAGAGAAAGALIGSVVPVVGTAIGAGVGAGVGAIGGAIGASQVEGDADFGFNSTGAIALGKAAKGERVDLGTGFFSGGEVRAEHSRRANEIQVGGKSFTAGRLVAASVSEPGSRPYNVLSGLLDASVAIKGDPAAIAGGKIKNVRQAGRLFVTDADAAGLLNAARKTVITERVDGWLAGDGLRVIEKLAGTNDTYDVWKLLGRKVEPAVAAQLADARSTDEVQGILRPLLGVELREKPQVPGVLREAITDRASSAFEARFKKNPRSIRLLGSMPGGAFHLDDAEQSVKQMENFLRNARVSEGTVAKYVDRLARATSPIEKYNVIVTDMLGEVMTELTGKVGSQKAQKLTTAWRNNYRELSKYFVDEIGENVGTKAVTIAGREFQVPTPHLYSEYINGVIPSPDARAIRRITSGTETMHGRLWSKAVNSKSWDVTTNVLDFLSQDVWKPFALLRGAWTVRVVGEEQVRMAASGLDSLVSHPLRAIAWATGRSAKGATDVLGAEFDALDDVSDFARSLSQRGGGWRKNVVSHGKTIVSRDDDIERYAQGLQSEIGQLASDPIARVVAGGVPEGSMPGVSSGNPVEDAKVWFRSGKGNKFRRELAEASGMDDLLTDAGADAYIDSVFKRIRIKTGDDPRLLDAVATGKLNGQSLADPSVRTELQAFAAEGVGPEFAKVDISLAGRPTAGGKVGEYMNQATDFLFTNLMSKETNYLSRSPAFRQFYYQRLVELTPFMDEAAKDLAMRGARQAGLDDVAEKIGRLAKRGSGDLSLEEADVVAKGFGLDATKKLLFDLSEKSQAADITRIIFPFAEAWREILTNWSRIGVENPAVIRRAQQGIEGARGAGFFSKDPATGQEMFNYPGTGFIMKKLTGVEAPFRGSAAALNLFSNNPFIPGFGPVVQVSVGKLIPDKPQWDSVRDLVTPYGEADTGDGYIESFLPAWMQKVRTSFDDPESDRTFANTVMDVSRYLVSTGEYSTSTTAEQERLSAAAIEKSRNMYRLRAFAQWFAPSAPSPQFMAHDKNGNLVTAFKLTEEFRKLQEADYDTAVQKFLEIYGEDALLFMQPKSRGGFTPTDKLHEWVRNNPQLAERHSDVYGFFAPTDGEFNITEMDRQIATGEREALTPKEAVELANARVAGAKYRAARERVGAKPSASQKAWLRSVRDALVAEYPGYEPEKFEAGTVESKIRSLQAAAEEPAIVKTDAGQALVRYLAARDKAIAAANAKGLSGFGRAKSMRSTRTWLRGIAESLAAEHPNFLPLYERVLEREMVDDEVTEAASA